MSEVAKLKVGDKDLELPIITGTENEKGIDIGKLRGTTGLVTLDQGYVNTGSTTSGITFLNGEEGVLRYRGYPIEQLAANCDFIEVAYLLVYGELPTKAELDAFQASISSHTMLHEDLKSFYDGFPRDAHPMAILSSVVGALSTFYQDSLDPHDPEQVEVSIHRLIAKLPTIASYAYKKSLGQPFCYPDNDSSYSENFLQMMFSTPCEEYKSDPVFVNALNLLLIVHADHEQNCSTSTVRMVGSADSNLFASISSGICALWGPLHGGANEAVVKMLNQIKDDGGDVDKYVKMAKDKEDGFRLMGFGHAQKLEKVALEDKYFVDRKLYPNVDFYSGVIYRAMGIPVEMFTVLFAIGRLPGWIAHWKEMQNSPTSRICRPRQIYTGALNREFVELGKR